MLGLKGEEVTTLSQVTPLDDRIEHGVAAEECDCEFTPYEHITEESWHYLRRCQKCGKLRYSLHCPHDGVQSRCDCGERYQSVPWKVRNEGPKEVIA